MTRKLNRLNQTNAHGVAFQKLWQKNCEINESNFDEIQAQVTDIQAALDAANAAAADAAAAAAAAAVAALTANWSGVTDDDGNRPDNNATLGADLAANVSNNDLGNITDTASRKALASNSVQTSYIQNNAVTNPTSAYTTGSVSVPATATWTNIQTVTITATGAPINIVAAFYAGDSEYGAAFETDGQFQLVRDSTVIYGPVNVSKYNSGGGIRGTGPNSATILDQPSSGSRTYKLQAYLAATGTVLTPTYRSLVIMEAKK